MSALLSKKDILKADDLEIIEVEVPEWGGSVMIRQLTGTGRDAFENMLYGDDGDQSNIRAKLCAMTLCDEKGVLLFSEGDVIALGQKSSKALDKVFIESKKFNKMMPDSVSVAEKNS